MFLDEGDMIRLIWSNDADIPFVGYFDLLIQLENIEKPDIIIPFLVISKTIDCPFLSFNAIKKLLENLRYQKLVRSLLQNS